MQDIRLLNTVYEDVPAVELPKEGGGTARFDDTSDANATASDIVSGKTAYVNGSKLTGTHVLPTGTLSITSNDTYDVTNYASAVVNVPNPSTGTISITSNGTVDVTNYASADVDVPSGFSIDDYMNYLFTGTATYTGNSMPAIMLRNQTGITSLSFPNATGVGNLPSGSFSTMSGLVSFSAPKLTKVAAYMLEYCTALTDVNLRSLTDTNSSLMSGCTSLEVVVLPSVSVMYSQTFKNCSNLQKVDVLVSNGITNQNNFNGCTKLDTLIIRKSGVATLINTNNFTGTPFASDGTGGTLYVPSAQISSYQSATNWSTILGYANNSIVAIEGSQYENYYADGTAIGS